MSKSKKEKPIEEFYQDMQDEIATQLETNDDLNLIQAKIKSAKELSRSDALSLITKLEERKGAISRRIYKDLIKDIKRKAPNLSNVLEIRPGPMASDKDIENIKRKLLAFFKSPFMKEFPPNEKISFYLGGSLVSGYCMNKTKPYYGQPSDFGRISDVDICVFISSNLFDLIFQDKRLIEKHLGHRRTLPIGEEEKFSSDYSGLFKSLIEDLGKLAVAGFQRKVNFTFFEHSLLDLLEIKKEHLIKIVVITTI